MKYLTAEQVLFIHARLLVETGGSHGVRDLSMLLSALRRLQTSFNDQGLYPDLFNKAAALLDSLIRKHPFVDGNKRTGSIGQRLFIEKYQGTMRRLLVSPLAKGSLISGVMLAYGIFILLQATLLFGIFARIFGMAWAIHHSAWCWSP